MKTLIFALMLCLPMQVQAQKPFSKPWVFNTTRPWSPGDSLRAGALVAILANIYTHQSGHYKYPALVAVLYTMAISLTYEVYRWADGHSPLALNSVWAGAGAAPVSLTFRYTWGNGHSSLKVGP